MGYIKLYSENSISWGENIGVSKFCKDHEKVTYLSPIPTITNVRPRLLGGSPTPNTSTGTVTISGASSAFSREGLADKGNSVLPR